jgi:pimeloyl-ACP methyl ester carboxylesterase
MAILTLLRHWSSFVRRMTWSVAAVLMTLGVGLALSAETDEAAPPARPSAAASPTAEPAEPATGEPDEEEPKVPGKRAAPGKKAPPVKPAKPPADDSEDAAEPEKPDKGETPKPKASRTAGRKELTGADLRTSDGVGLCATFYPGAATQDTVPVILLHSYKSDRTEFAQLAEELHKLGYAVLVPDLRGHGESVEQRVGTTVRKLDAARMPNEQFASMVQYDMETLKKYLTRHNNERKLNLEKLCIVGSEMGASVALDWAVFDWSWPPLGGQKQGQYVKGLVLLSPPWKFRTLDAKRALDHPMVRSKVSVYILVGKENPKVYGEVQRLHAFFERYHPEPPKESVVARKDLFFKGLDTKFQGAKMLDDDSLEIPKKIHGFLYYRLASQDYPWHEIGRKPVVEDEK